MGGSTYQSNRASLHSNQMGITQSKPHTRSWHSKPHSAIEGNL